MIWFRINLIFKLAHLLLFLKSILSLTNHDTSFGNEVARI